MAATLILLLYLIVGVWIVVDSYINSGKASALERFGAFIWSSTIGALLAVLVVLWWFLRAFLGTFIKLLTGIDVQPSRRDTNRAKKWVVFPQEQAAMGLTGRGSFKWTP